MTILSAQKLAIGYGKHTVLHSFSATLAVGQLVALIGRNGTGKTTLLRTLAGLQKPHSGEVWLQGLPIQSYSAQARAQLLAYVSTERLTLEYFTVLEVLQTGRHPHTNWYNQLSSGEHDLVQAVAKQLDIVHLLPKTLHHLSDGERQKVMIARALVQDTPLLLLDEPTAHLDWQARREVFELLRSINKTTQKTMLIATHELDLAEMIADATWRV